MKKPITKQIIVIGLLVAIEIILSRFFSIATPIVKISIAFLPMVVGAILYGPFWSSCCAGIADLIGALLFPIGSYFPGFTLTAILTGAVYGIFLYRKPLKLWRIISAVLIICLILNLGLDTYWLSILFGKSVIALLPARIIKCIIIAPVQILLVKFVIIFFNEHMKATTV